MFQILDSVQPRRSPFGRRAAIIDALGYLRGRRDIATSRRCTMRDLLHDGQQRPLPPRAADHGDGPAAPADGPLLLASMAYWKGWWTRIGHSATVVYRLPGLQSSASVSAAPPHSPVNRFSRGQRRLLLPRSGSKVILAYLPHYRLKAHLRRDSQREIEDGRTGEHVEASSARTSGDIKKDGYT